MSVLNKVYEFVSPQEKSGRGPDWKDALTEAERDAIYQRRIAESGWNDDKIARLEPARAPFNARKVHDAILAVKARRAARMREDADDVNELRGLCAEWARETAHLEIFDMISIEGEVATPPALPTENE